MIILVLVSVAEVSNNSFTTRQINNQRKIILLQPES